MNIKREELRIGNIVHATTAGRDGEIVEFIIMSGKDIDNAAWYFPIPLSENWLIRLGIIDIDSIKASRSPFGKYLKITVYGGYSVEYESNGLQTNGNKELKYVHELQNWYHYFYGEELSVTRELND